MSKQCKDKWARPDLLHLNSSANMASWLCFGGRRVPMSCIILASGAARHAEEAVLSDRPTGSARKRELPEREKQSARHASEGRSGRCVLLPPALHRRAYAALMPAGEREAGVFGWKVCRVVCGAAFFQQPRVHRRGGSHALRAGFSHSDVTCCDFWDFCSI